MSRALFITGTGTDVGKTYISGLIVKKLAESGRNAAYYKAAMSGNRRDSDGKLIPGDAVQVKSMSGIGQGVDSMCPYVYETAVSPHLASRLEGNPVILSVVKSGFTAACENYEYITMEGSGGILCPICFDEEKIQLEDIIKELRLPSLIIADAGLGTINSVVLTVEYMRSKNLPVSGIIMNHWHSDSIMKEDNLRMCEYMTGLKVIACVSDNDTDLNVDVEVLARLYEKV